MAFETSPAAAPSDTTTLGEALLPHHGPWTLVAAPRWLDESLTPRLLTERPRAAEDEEYKVVVLEVESPDDDAHVEVWLTPGEAGRLERMLAAARQALA